MIKSTPLRQVTLLGLVAAAVVALYILPRQIAFGVLVVPTVIFITWVGIRSQQQLYHIPRWLHQHLAGSILNVKTAFIIAVLATAAFHPLIDGRYWYIGVMLVFVGALLLAARDSTTRTDIQYTTQPLSPISYWRVGIAMFAALLLFASIIRSFPSNWLQFRFLTIHVQHGLFVGGIVLLLVSASIWQPKPIRLDYRLLIIGVIVCIAFALRFVQLETQLPYMIEEWHYAEPASWMDNDTPLFYQMGFFTTAPRIYVYWQKYFGAWLGGGSLGLRGISAIMGTLAVIATAFLTRELFDVKEHKRLPINLSLIAATFLATHPAHIHYSRIAQLNNMDALTIPLAVAFLLRALRLNDRFSFVAAGIALGMTHYFYEVGKLIAIPLVLLWLTLSVILGRHLVLLSRWRGLLWTASVAVLVASLPWIIDQSTDVDSVARLRSGSVVLNPEASINDMVMFAIGNLSLSVTTLTSHGDALVSYFVSEQGLIPVWMLVFASLGLMIVLAQPMRHNHLIVWLLVLATIAANALAHEVMTPRYTIVFPAIAIISALGLAATAQAFFPPKARQWVLIVATAFICTVNATYYWGNVVPTQTQQHFDLVKESQTYSLQDTITRLETLPPSTTAHIFSDNYYGMILQTKDYYAPHVSVNLIDLNSEDWQTDIDKFPGSVPNVVFVERHDTQTTSVLRFYYELSDPVASPNENFPPEVTLLMYTVLGRR